MTTYLIDGEAQEARQVIGQPLKTFEVATWIAIHGNPWLIGNANNPEELRAPGDPDTIPTRGTWIRPEDGAIMIRSGSEDLPVVYGDWVVRSPYNNFYVVPRDQFNYEATEEPSNGPE